MTPSEKFQEEKEELKSQRKNRILAAAHKLFAEKGIDTIAMTDIAKEAEIGVASLYRYYATKDEIAIQSGIWAWNKQKKDFMPKVSGTEFDSKSGYKQLEIIFDAFIELYETQGDFLRFIYFFDSYAVRTHITQERLIEYEKEIFDVQNVVKGAIEKGIAEKEILCDDSNKLYFTLMQALFSTSQKLTLNKNLLQMDSKNNDSEELKLLGKILLQGIRG